MAIVQISKIIHRTGSADEIPQLDVGEIGFASDEQRVFIGNDKSWVPPVGNNPTNTEILTNSPNCMVGFNSVVTYSDDSARDEAIPHPKAGMIVFNIGAVKFQGYAGSSWVNLN